jgi:hypothetical protein
LSTAEDRRTEATGAAPREHRWQAALAILIALLLYVRLPDQYIGLPRYLIPALESVLLVAVLIIAPHRHGQEPAWQRWLGIALIALINAANAVSLVLLIHGLLDHSATNGRDLIIASIDIWLTNVIVFGLWYWELDRGGPGARLRSGDVLPPDFLFPQMTLPHKLQPVGWRPHFLDYLYVAFTNAAAFSPTDTMPLSVTAKSLMLVQSMVSLLTIALVAARAVNILQ